MRKGIVTAVLVSMLAAAPVLAATAAPEGTTPPAKPAKSTAKKRPRRHAQKRGAHGTKPAADTTTPGSTK
jgi:hypothetical protein